MNRRSFLALLWAVPLAPYIPAPKIQGELWRFPWPAPRLLSTAQAAWPNYPGEPL